MVYTPDFNLQSLLSDTETRHSLVQHFPELAQYSVFNDPVETPGLDGTSSLPLLSYHRHPTPFTRWTVDEDLNEDGTRDSEYVRNSVFASCSEAVDTITLFSGIDEVTLTSLPLEELSVNPRIRCSKCLSTLPPVYYGIGYRGLNLQAVPYRKFPSWRPTARGHSAS